MKWYDWAILICYILVGYMLSLIHFYKLLNLGEVSFIHCKPEIVMSMFQGSVFHCIVNQQLSHYKFLCVLLVGENIGSMTLIFSKHWFICRYISLVPLFCGWQDEETVVLSSDNKTHSVVLGTVDRCETRPEPAPHGSPVERNQSGCT